jgi:transcriptional regulator with XRE-family HTH domain
MFGIVSTMKHNEFCIEIKVVYIECKKGFKRDNMHKLSYNVDKLLDRLEQMKRATDPRFHLSDAAFAEAVGISRSQAIKILRDKARRVDFETIELLLDFFHREGMPIGVADLFVVSDE